MMAPEKMKVMTVFGTRPEIIRLSVLLGKLDDLCTHVTVHTGQNYEENLSDIFLRDLEVRQPDHHLGIRANGFGEQLSQILSGVDDLLKSHRPDRVLILGDTNSALSAIVAARRGIPIYHMEAGNRCYDDRVPEEINRRIVDHTSTVLLPYTRQSRDNLLREGILEERVIVTGNPIKEVIDTYADGISGSGAMDALGVDKGRYFLVTAHRAENVDVEDRLLSVFRILDKIAEKYGLPVLVSVHPRTAQRLREHSISGGEGVRFLEPLSFFDFVNLEKNALAVLTDSGTVQEECCIFRVPNLTIRDVTERPETLECGSNILCGVDEDRVMEGLSSILSRPPSWNPPAEYLVDNVSDVVSRIILG